MACAFAPSSRAHFYFAPDENRSRESAHVSQGRKSAMVYRVRRLARYAHTDSCHPYMRFLRHTRKPLCTIMNKPPPVKTTKSFERGWKLASMSHSRNGIWSDPPGAGDGRQERRDSAHEGGDVHQTVFRNTHVHVFSRLGPPETLHGRHSFATLFPYQYPVHTS